MTEVTPIAKARTPKLAYFLDDYADETIPCGTSLADWAEWLSKPDPDWDRDAPANDGDIFAASVLRFEADIVATHGANGWTFSRDPAGASFLAVRFGPGLGWSADDILDTQDPAESLREYLAETADVMSQTECVAVAFDEPPVRLTYRIGPDPYFEIEPLNHRQTDEVTA